MRLCVENCGLVWVAVDGLTTMKGVTPLDEVYYDMKDAGKSGLSGASLQVWG